MTLRRRGSTRCRHEPARSTALRSKATRPSWSKYGTGAPGSGGASVPAVFTKSRRSPRSTSQDTLPESCVRCPNSATTVPWRRTYSRGSSTTARTVSRSDIAATLTARRRACSGVASVQRHVVRRVEAAAQERDQGRHLVHAQPERAGADVVTPQRQHDQVGLVVPGDPQGAIATAGVEEDLPGRRQRASGDHAPVSRCPGDLSPVCRAKTSCPRTGHTGPVPELPEVEALALDLKGRLDGHAIGRVHVVAFSALKTFDPPVQALEGTLVDDVTRHGKFLDIETSGLHLVFHLARAGWVRWRDELPPVPPRPSNKSPLAVRVILDDGSGLDITEAGTKKSLAMYVVRSPHDVPGIASLGPDPLDDAFTRETLDRILQDAGRSQIKGVLRHQGTIAGIGNAYSDEILHAAKMSPFKPANSLTSEELDRLFAAVKDELGDAVARSRGLAASELKSEKKTNLAVHGRAGEKCPVCGDTVREVSFADSRLQYCPPCQTGGKPLADRRMSRLLK